MRSAVWSGLILAFIINSAAYAQNDHLPASVCATLTQERAKYPASGGLTKAQIGKLLNDTAAKHASAGFGLLGKRSGNRCPIPGSSVTISCDFLVRKVGTTYTGWDALTDSEGAARVNCGRADSSIPEQIASGNRTFVVPTGSSPTPDPDPEPDPCPEPEPCPTCPPDLRTELERRTKERDAAEAAKETAIAERNQARLERDACLSQPAPTCEAKLWGFIPVPCRVIR